MLSFFSCCFQYFFFVFNCCQFDYCVSRCVSPWVYPAWDSLRFLDLGGYFLSHVREVFDYNLFKYFLGSFLSSRSGTPIMRMLLRLMLSQRSLRLSSFLFVLFSLFCSMAVNSTILSSRSLIRSSASVILLLIPSSVLFSFCIVHLCSLILLVVFSLILLGLC